MGRSRLLMSSIEKFIGHLKAESENVLISIECVSLALFSGVALCWADRPLSTQKSDRGLGQLLHDELHWLDVPDCVFFKLLWVAIPTLSQRAPSAFHF